MNEVQIFNYEAMPVRTVEKDGEVWFVAKDVCDILGIQNPTDAIKILDEDERARFNLGRSPIHGGGGEANIINESGLYTLIMRSNKPEAKTFRKWVTSEVLPSIRKTGSYNADEHDRRMKEFDKAMDKGIKLYKAMGYRGVKLGVALDKIYKEYLGFSALEIAGIDPNEAVSDCTPRWVRRVLNYMKEHDTVTPSELAQALDLKPSVAKTHLFRMVNQGYLRRIGYGRYVLEKF